MPNRIIKESIKTSVEIDSLSWFEEVCFYRILVTVDDYGCMDGRTTVVRNQLFPTKDSVTSKSIETALSTLETKGLIRKYFHEGHPYIFVTNWEKHQRIRNRERKFPDPDECPSEDLSATRGQLTATRGQLSATCCQLSADCGLESNPIQSESESNPKGQTPFAVALDEFRKYRKQIGKKLTPKAETMLLNELEKISGGDEETKIKILDRSIMNGWTGVFPLKEDRHGKKDYEQHDYKPGELDALLVDLDK